MLRIAVVTGSSSGIGRATATRFLEAGFTVIGLARHHDNYAMKHDLYHPRVVDFSDIEKVDKIAVDISKDYPKLEELINNMQDKKKIQVLELALIN